MAAHGPTRTFGKVRNPVAMGGKADIAPSGPVAAVTVPVANAAIATAAGRLIVQCAQDFLFYWWGLAVGRCVPAEQ
jgi:hypothetical protein